MAEYLTVSLPGAIEPLERSERFASALDRALKKAGRLGKTVGGGTGMMVYPFEIVCSHIDLEVTRLDRAVPVIQDVLARTEAPPGTVVGHPESDTLLIHVTAAGPESYLPSELPLKPPPPRYPWAVGEVVGYRLTRDRFVLLHVRANDHGLLLLTVADWCGRALPGAAAIPELIARRATSHLLGKVFWFQTKRFGPFPSLVRLRPPPALNRRRTLRTGVVVPPDNARGFVTAALPRGFDRVLRETFGLVPMDGATRLRHDLGLMVPHLAVWDAVGPVTAAGARKLFYGYASRGFRPDHPDRVAVAPTANLARFVAGLKDHFRTDEAVWTGNFGAREGFVIVPVAEGRMTDVWPVAVRLGRRYGITCYDARRHRVNRPQRPADPMPAAKMRCRARR